ncbi:hypothetical protein TCAL_09049 [Tigriopus californicus]|uniref:SEFIR domain-containing protein n=1 Tax=Tigriopus californicus TaxID=6832 RepID=A0A553P1N7_TIGCA|nr:hypothetical protein TCAL_09049 [Tigriopus californicus]
MWLLPWAFLALSPVQGQEPSLPTTTLFYPLEASAQPAHPAQSAPSSPSARNRTCCLYNPRNENGLCSDVQGCILRFPHNGTLYSPLIRLKADNLTTTVAEMNPAFCEVVHDSKPSLQTDLTDLAPAEACLGQFELNTLLPEEDEVAPFELRPYVFQDAYSSQGMPGIDVQIGDDSLRGHESFRMRIQNTALCPEDADQLAQHPDCKPRCVEIEKSRMMVQPRARLSYDCEVGFYVNQDDHVVVTTGQTYQIDFCSGLRGQELTCSSFYFAMPNVEHMPPILPLLDRTALLFQKRIAVTLPVENEYTQVEVLRREESEAEPKLFHTQEVRGKRNANFHDILKPGYYSIILKSDRDDLDHLVAEFHVPDQTGSILGLVLLLLFVIAAIFFGAYTYKRYQTVKQSNLVSPNRLLEAERISPKSVFIITNVDNRHHIDIVLSFSKYLKNHCAVGEVYFALDPKTGINSHPQHDPWKWAQDVADKMGSLDNSCLVFIGAPPSTMGLCIYRDLPNNQAFVSTKYLKNMCDEDRVAIVQFPYSDPDTIPNLVPPHIRAKPWNLPKDMNSFLCQLLEIKKRELYPCIRLPIVQPQVVPQDIEKFPGGREMLENISNLAAKADRHKAELKAATSATLNGGGAGSTLSRTTEFSTFSDSEERGLLRSQKAADAKPDRHRVEEEPIKIEIEPHMFSLRGESAPKRDQAVDPEFLT